MLLSLNLSYAEETAKYQPYLFLTLVKTSPPTLKIQGDLRSAYVAQDESVEFAISFAVSSIPTFYLVKHKPNFPVVLGVTIKNKLDESIAVKWDSVIDPNSMTHKVVKSGTRLILRNEPVGDLIIPPNAKIGEIMLPTDALYFVDEWFSDPVLEKLQVRSALL